MKTTFTLLAFSSLMLLSSMNLKGQSCLLLSDSISSGDEATRVTHYYYDVSDRINVVHQIDSNSTVVNKIDSLFYDANSNYSLIKTYYENLGSYYLQKTLTFTANASNQITRIHLAYDNGSTPWEIAHDISYNGSGQMTDAIVDPTSITGNPDGFDGNFENITWVNGNVATLDLIADFGAGSTDTIELTSTVDNKNNIERLKYISEVGDMIGHFNVNNWVTVVTANNEVFGPAGTTAIENSFTYDSNDEVAQHTELPGLFESITRVHDYEYLCTTVGLTEVQNNSIELYPNPTDDELNIKLDYSISGNIKIYNTNGKLVYHSSINGLSKRINLDLAPGMYIVNISNEEGNVHLEKVIIK